MKIMLLCQSLVVGGTQRQIALLAPALRRRGHDVSVAVFYCRGPFAAELVAGGVPLHDLGKHGRWDVIGFLSGLRRRVAIERPDVLYAFLPVPNIIAALIKLVVYPAPRVVFGVRSARMLRSYDWLTHRQYRIEALLSSLADGVIVNSSQGLVDTIARGFRARHIAVVSNGTDTDLFAPDPDARARLRAEWGIGEHEVLVGQVARFDPMKGHDVFFAAATRLSCQSASWRFVCIGIDDNKRVLVQALADRIAPGLRLILAGARTDMASCFSALDIACQASHFGEGFPNAVSEAMACGVPCVVTDVGDARAIVGDLGVVVPAGDAAALANGLAEMRARLERERSQLAVAVRRSITERFSVTAFAEATERALQVALS